MGERLGANIPGPEDHATGPAVHPEVGLVHLVPDPWTGIWRGRQHIACRLSDYFTSVWMDPPLHWRKILKEPRTSKVYAPDNDSSPNLLVCRPGVFLPDFHRLRQLSDWTFRLRLKKALHLVRERGCRRFVLMIWRPAFRRALDLITHDLACYYVNDEYSFTMEDPPTRPEEEWLLRRADLVFVHSPSLFEKKRGFNDNTFYSPNGVEFSQFATPQAEPRDLSTIPHPRIGYIGVLKRQLDWALIETLARQHSSYSFVFIGPISSHTEAREAVTRLSRFENCHFLGTRPAQAMPAYVQHFDVCIMPYLRVPYTDYIYPLKLHEYLATGRPVLGTPINSLKEFQDVVELAVTPAEWSVALKRCLAREANTQVVCDRRREVARRNDWGSLARQVADRILEKLGTKPSP